MRSTITQDCEDESCNALVSGVLSYDALFRMCWPGFLFRAQPTLMTLERSATIMDAIFTSHEEEGRGRLLKILQDFLVSEASKHAAKEKGTLLRLCLLPLFNPSSLEGLKGHVKSLDVNMDELVGNTDGFADSGYVNLQFSTTNGLMLRSPASARLLSKDISVRS